MESSTDVFDRVLEIVGSDGRFQKSFKNIYNIGFVLIASLASANLILIMSIPDHWCYFPGRELTNQSSTEWKRTYIPVTKRNGIEAFSQCRMYNVSIADTDHRHNNDTIHCRYGYEFDKTWLKSTVPISESWVCDKQSRITNSFTITTVGNIIGAFILGYLSDKYGRRLSYFVGVATAFVGGVMTVFTANSYPWFLFSLWVAAFSSYSHMQAVLVISMEISRPDQRAYIATLQNTSSTVASCILPLIFWLLGNWKLFVLATTLPLAIYFASYLYIIESPRWLATQGRVQECVMELKRIAHKNGTVLPAEAIAMLEENDTKEYNRDGMISVFSSATLARNTILLLLAAITCGLCSYVIVLRAANMEGNPFLNFFLQSAVSLPGFYIGMFSAEYMGRRATGVWAYVLVTLTNLTTMMVPGIFIEVAWLGTTKMVVNNFFLTIATYVVSLQFMELYPTSMRQSGMALGYGFQSAFSILGPYIVLLEAVDLRYPSAILGTLTFLAALSEFILPETLNVKLPENLEEAKVFGQGQPYFRLPE